MDAGVNRSLAEGLPGAIEQLFRGGGSCHDHAAGSADGEALEEVEVAHPPEGP